MKPSREAVLRLMGTATADASGIAHRVRVAILALVLARLVFSFGDEMLAGEPKHWVTTGFLLAGGFASFLLNRRASQSLDPGLRLMVATLLDAFIATVVVLPSVLWPRDTYLGALRAPEILIFPVVAAAGGLRMTYRSAATGAAAAMGGMAVLVGIDLTQNAQLIHYGFPEILLASVIMVGAGLLALGTVRLVQSLLIQTATRTTEATRVRQQFGAYMAEEFAQIVLDAPGQPEAKRTHAVVLFSDLRGFTQYSEGIEPDQLISELNDYLNAVVGPIHAYGGVVDKYIGDAIMAVFGLPEPSPQDHTRAILAAAAMQAALEEHNTKRAERGLPPMRQGIGVHAGEVIAGPVGTPERLQFTLLGDTVNVAARLESETKTTGHSVLLSAELVRRAQAEGADLPRIEPGPSLQLRGRTEPVSTYILSKFT